MDLRSDARPVRGRRERLRQEIASLSREVAMLKELASRQPLAESATDAVKSLQRLRASLLQTHLAEKQTQLESLAAREEALGPEKVGGTDWFATANRLVGTASNLTAARLGTRRVILAVVLLAAIAIVPAALLRVPFSDVLAFKAEPPGITVEEVQILGELAPAIHEPVGEPGESFFTRMMSVSYSDARVFLSGQPYPSEFAVDDRIEITVTRPDGSTSTWARTFNEDCVVNRPLAPQDITDLFAPGQNTVTVLLYDICGATRGTSGPLLLSNRR